MIRFGRCGSELFGVHSKDWKRWQDGPRQHRAIKPLPSVRPAHTATHLLTRVRTPAHTLTSHMRSSCPQSRFTHASGAKCACARAFIHASIMHALIPSSHHSDEKGGSEMFGRDTSAAESLLFQSFHVIRT